MKVKGDLSPLRDRILVSDMEFGITKTKSGILVSSTDGKETGIVPRWGKVWAIGPEQKDVKVGEWILVEHGRWTRGVEYVSDDGSETVLRMVEAKAVMLVSPDEPTDQSYARNI